VPLVAQSTFKPVPLLGNAHIQTLLPALFRRVRRMRWRRERLNLADGDFIDFDWLSQASERLLVVAHGLEGSSRRPYVAGLARAAQRGGWDVLAWNFRGCSGEMNRLPRYYHSGATEDLAAVVTHAAGLQRFKSIAVAGFSLGGNLALKFLGEDNPASEHVSAGVTISVPCDLKAAAEAMEGLSVRPYMRKFRKDILRKWDRKRRRFPDNIPRVDPARQRTFRHLDDTFTAPIHGFGTAENYWAACSANRFLAGIRKPTLIINAADDPFLAPSCFPREAARRSAHVHLEIPAHGGHVGFVNHLNDDEDLWSEARAVEFLNEAVPG
jgi:uncharacterized protein